MAINKFGQYVRLEVTDRAGSSIFTTDSLRVDFDIRNKVGWERAKVSVYNLAPATAKLITASESYVTLYTSLHGGVETKVVDRLFVSNTIWETIVPNTITSLFCYSSIRRFVLEKQISIYVPRPSLKNLIEGILAAAGFTGDVSFKNFPKGYETTLPLKPESKQEGSPLACLDILAKMHRFKYFVDGGTLKVLSLVYPNHINDTDFSKSTGEITLSTNNMRANPQFGVATIDIVSNLDAKIKPAATLDISNLLTAGTGISEEQLMVIENMIVDAVASYNKYEVTVTQHTGSNFTGEWLTRAHGIAPSTGYTMSKDNWFK